MSQGPAGLSLDEATIEHHSGGTVLTWLRRPLLITRVTGRLTLVAARTIDNATRRLIQPGGRYLSFHDWEDLDDYDSDARRLLVEASARNRASIEQTHVLLRSRIIVAALDTARIFLKHIVPHSSRSTFEAELHKALKRNNSSAPPAP
jgi:hypothetical protein